MKVRSVIIDSINLDLNDKNYADLHIQKLSQLLQKVVLHQRNPIVLLNEDGDELLRRIPKLIECDLVFSKKSPRRYEGLFIGLKGAGTCAFYLPIEADYGDENTWLSLEKTLLQLPYMNNIHIVIPKTEMPWLITPSGTLYLKSKDDSYDLENDPQLNKRISP